MNFQTHPYMKAQLEKYPTDNDVRQIGRLLDEHLTGRKRGFFLGDSDEPLAAIAHELGHSVLALDLREYGKSGLNILPEADHPRLQADFFSDLTEFTEEQSYDYVVAVSAVEHFGLSEFGGVQDHYGDVWAMRKLWSLLRPGGKCFVTLPVKYTFSVCPHWRGYSSAALSMRIVGPFKVLHEEFWWTSVRGNGQASRADIDKYDDGADLSAVLVLEKP